MPQFMPRPPDLCPDPRTPTAMIPEGHRQAIFPEMPLSLGLRPLAAASLRARGYTQVLILGNVVNRDPGTYWHIAVGRWIIAHRAVPHEPFSPLPCRACCGL